VKKKQALPMKEILIAGGVLAAILAIALVIGYFKKSGVTELEKAAQKQTEILERNIASGTAELKKAVDLGSQFCIGKDTIDPKDPSKLFAPFKGNAKIYNVIYNRDFKDKKQVDKHEQFTLVDDLEHRTLKELNKNIPDDKDLKDVSVRYALADEKGKQVAVVVAKKMIRTKDDNVNSGGQIMVIVLAEEDDFFKKALSKTFDAPKPVEVKTPATEKAATPEKK